MTASTQTHPTNQAQSLQRKETIEWLKKQSIGSLSSTLGNPSVTIKFGDPHEAIKHIELLKEAPSTSHMQIVAAPDHSSLTFIGDEALFYLVRKQIRFEEDAEYIRRFDLGKKLIAVAHDAKLDKSERHDKISELLDQRAYPNTRDEGQDTALHFLARENDMELSEKLLKADANPNASNVVGDMPLHFVIEMARQSPEDAAAYLPMIRLLKEYGANPHRSARGKPSPYEEALSYPKDEHMKSIIQALGGVSVSARMGSREQE